MANKKLSLVWIFLLLRTRTIKVETYKHKTKGICGETGKIQTQPTQTNNLAQGHISFERRCLARQVNNIN